MQANKFYLEADDFGMLLPGLEDLRRIKAHYPGFKFTAFTIPMPKEFFLPENQKHFNKEKYKKWAAIVNDLDWLEVAVHGFSHTHFEFDCSYEKANTMLQAIENMFEEIGLKYKKIFRAPYWQYSYDALCALRDRGYVVAIDRNGPVPVPEGTEVYTYNWSLEERMLPQAEVVMGHGHMYPTGRTKNALYNCFKNITKRIPPGSEFGFISDLFPEA